MAELGALGKILGVLGVMVLFAGLLYGAGGPPVFATLSSGFPVFDNPFSQAHRMYTLHPAGDDNTVTPSTAHDAFETDATGVDDPACDTDNSAGLAGAHQFWGCLTDFNSGPNTGVNKEPDGYQTYITLASGAPAAQVVLDSHSGGAAGNHLITSVKVNYNCLSGSATYVKISFAFLDAASTPLPGQIGVEDSIRCDIGAFANHSATLDWSLAGVTIDDLDGGRFYMVSGGTPSGAIGTILLTWAEIVVSYSPTLKCTGSAIDQANCYISQFLQFILDGLTFILNLLLFGIAWIVFVISFIGDLIASLLWFYNVPGMPPVIQGIVDIVVTVIAGILVYTVVRLLRGSGPV